MVLAKQAQTNPRALAELIKPKLKADARRINFEGYRKGKATAAAEKSSWDDQIRTRIFAPLGMASSSTTVRALAEQPNVATPHYDLNDTVVTAPWKNGNPGRKWPTLLLSRKPVTEETV